VEETKKIEEAKKIAEAKKAIEAAKTIEEIKKVAVVAMQEEEEEKYQPEAVVECKEGESEVEIVYETVSKKFGEMSLEDFASEEDSDYSPSSDCDTEDSLEWASETEHTLAEDALADNVVGVDYFKVAVDTVTSHLASYRLVRLALLAQDWVLGTVEEVAPVEVAAIPVLSAIPSLRRTCRAARRAGEKVSGAPAATSITSLATSTLSSWSLAFADRLLLPTILAVFGLQIKSATTSHKSKIVLEEEEDEEVEAETVTVTFGELDLSDYDSEADADYSPGEEETEDELEYCSEEEVEEVCEVLAC